MKSNGNRGFENNIKYNGLRKISKLNSIDVIHDGIIGSGDIPNIEDFEDL